MFIQVKFWFFNQFNFLNQKVFFLLGASLTIILSISLVTLGHKKRFSIQPSLYNVNNNLIRDTLFYTLPEQMCHSQNTKSKEIQSKKQVNVFLAEQLKNKKKKTKQEFKSQEV